MATSWETLAEKIHSYADDLESMSPGVAERIRAIAYEYVPKVDYKTDVMYTVENKDGFYYFATWDNSTQSFRDANGKIVVYKEDVRKAIAEWGD